LDEAFGVADLLEQEKQKARQLAYGDRNLKGLRVEHDMDDFGEGRTVILTLKDQDVLNEEEGDTLVNVNMLDDERYKKNVSNKKLNPLSYGYNVYEEQYDELGNPIERSITSITDIRSASVPARLSLSRNRTLTVSGPKVPLFSKLCTPFKRGNCSSISKRKAIFQSSFDYNLPCNCLGAALFLA